MSIACGIHERFNELNKFEVNIYDVRTKKESYYSRSKDKPIQEIVDEVITKYGGDVGKVVVDESCLEPDQLEEFKKETLEKYGDLVHVATKDELNFEYCLELKVEYSVGDFIILFKAKNYWEEGNRQIILYQCTEVVERRVTWKEMDRREYESTKRVDLEYAARMFRLKVDQVHLVFEDHQEKVDSLYGSELYKHAFKSINFIKKIYDSKKEALLLARYLISDPDVPVLVKTISSYRSSSSHNFIIQDWGFIHVPKLVKEYESRTDIMGIDLGSTRSVLAVSRNREIQVVPFDNSSPGDLWTESVISFDQEKPIIGKAAVRRLRTKPGHVIFDAKLICNKEHREKMSNQSIWSFKFNFKEEHPHLGSITYGGLRDFSLPQINKIFLEQMAEAASEYQNELNNGESVKKAVITVPRYYNWDKWQKKEYGNPLISYAIEAAKLANIEIIDIIEETHADLLYYFSHEKHSKMIKPGMEVAILDIGGGTCVCRVYTISEHEGKIYATCTRDSSEYDYIDSQYSGRSIDDIITNKLEESVPEDLRKNVKLRTLEEAKKIKCRLSVEEKIEFDLSEIHSRLEGIAKFTKEWFEGELRTHFKDKLEFDTFKCYPLTIQKRFRYERKHKSAEKDLLFNDMKFVFLAGGTCRIPFVQRWIGAQFPNANIIMDDQLEIITATGAAIHALQVLSGEVQPYIKPIQHPIACGITKDRYEFKVSIYDVRTKKKDDYSRSNDESIQEIIDELITKYGGDVGKIVVDESCLNSDQLEEFKKEALEKYGDLVHVATRDELEFDHYLKLKVEYSVGEFIVLIEKYGKYRNITLYQCTEVVQGRVTWKEMDRRHVSTGRVDLEYAARMFRLKVDQVHLVFEESQEKVDSLYGFELYEHTFKSINFIHPGYPSLLLARHLISDPVVPVLVKTISSDQNSSLQNFIIQDWGFIHFPKLVKEYESRTDIMGIDLGSTRSVLAVSRNREIQVVPFDNSSPGDLWTESVKKAVITVPEYLCFGSVLSSLISSIIEAAKLVNIEVIDIIEETHADLLYYLSNEEYSEMIKDKKEIAIFDIGEGICSGRIYEISEYKGKRYATCVGEVFEPVDKDCKYLGRRIDDIIMRKLKGSIPEDSRNNLKLRTLEAAKKIKHELSSKEKTEFHLSEIDSSLEGNVELTREWFEEELEGYFKNYKLYYNVFEQYPFPIQREFRCKRKQLGMRSFSSLSNVNIVFLAGGTCRIPFIQKWVKRIFPKAESIIKEQLEIITATGAAIHALQVLSGEVQPYIKPIQHPIACGITKDDNKFTVNIYNIRTKKESDYSQSKDKPIQEIVDELITKYGGDIGKIVVDESCLKSDKLEGFKKENLEKYGDLVHVATEEELDFKYLELKVEYSVGEFIVLIGSLIHWRINNGNITLYQCTEAVEGRVVWKEIDRRKHESTKRVDLEYAARMFRLKVDQVHLVFEHSQKQVDSLYGSELYNYGFKSINSIKLSYREPLLLARHLISDPDVPVLVKIISCDRNEVNAPRQSEVVKDEEMEADTHRINPQSEAELRTKIVKNDNDIPGDCSVSNKEAVVKRQHTYSRCPYLIGQKPDCTPFTDKHAIDEPLELLNFLLVDFSIIAIEQRFGRPPAKDCPPASDPNNLPRTGLQRWFSKSDFDGLFPKANHGWGPHKCLSYSYDAFIIASRYFPEFGTASRGGKGFPKSDLAKRDVAAFFAHVLQETGETDYGLYNSTLTPEEANECFYRGGLYHYYEGGPRSPFFPSSNRTDKLQPSDGKLCLPEGRYCNENPETKFWYPCDERNTTTEDENLAFKSCYFGRGPLQISWNYNYGQFQHFLKLKNINVDLVSEPHLIIEKMDPPLAMLSALWFYMTPQPPKPSMHDIMMGNWRPSQKNARAGYEGSVFGPTSLVINNECEGENTTAPEPGPPGENRRIKAFRFFAKKLGAPLESERLMSCKGMLDKFEAVPHKYSWQPDWANMWKAEPCDCAPTSYPGALPYYDSKMYPERMTKENDRNRLRCVYGIYANRDMYQISKDNSPCIKHNVKIRLTKDGI